MLLNSGSAALAAAARRSQSPKPPVSMPTVIPTLPFGNSCPSSSPTTSHFSDRGQSSPDDDHAEPQRYPAPTAAVPGHGGMETGSDPQYPGTPASSEPVEHPTSGDSDGLGLSDNSPAGLRHPAVLLSLRSQKGLTVPLPTQSTTSSSPRPCFYCFLVRCRFP